MIFLLVGEREEAIIGYLREGLWIIGVKIIPFKKRKLTWGK